MNKAGCLRLVALCALGSAQAAAATTAELYSPAWLTELNWAGGSSQSGSLYNAPPGSWAYVETQHLPWWEAQVAHPTENYDSSLLAVGDIRLDGALDMEYAQHRVLPGWTVQRSPTGIDNVYAFTPGSTDRSGGSGKGGQYAHFNLGLHPTSNLMGD